MVMEKYIAKPLSFQSLNGISEKTLEIHHGKLYQGYVNKTNEILERLAEADFTSANQIYSGAGELKRQFSFAWNGVVLHEGYFESLGGDGQIKDGNLKKAIEEKFGSIEKWKEDFLASGLAARGWVVLAYDFNSHGLQNYSCDIHNQGGIWGTAPIIVLDVYEHAYFIDFGADRKSYIETYFKNLNWQRLEKKFNKIKVEP